MSSSDTGAALIAEAKRRLFDESHPRIVKCLGELSEEEIWRRPRPGLASVGNLVLHICGNARQWICGGLGGAPDHRERQAEFDEEGPLPRAELEGILAETMAALLEVLDTVDPTTLLEPRPVQIYEETGLSIIVHVVEHVSYHTGQIAYWVKASKGIDLGFYEGLNLDGRS